jgi:hypothetical protein
MTNFTIAASDEDYSPNSDSRNPVAAVKPNAENQLKFPFEICQENKEQKSKS